MGRKERREREGGREEGTKLEIIIDALAHMNKRTSAYTTYIHTYVYVRTYR